MKTTQRLLNLFKTKPYSIEMGAGSISKWQHCSIKEVKLSKIIYYNSLKQETPKTRTTTNTINKRKKLLTTIN